MTTIQPSPKAYSYLRFSTPDQMKGDSFRRQSELSRKYAQEHGLDLDEALTFNDLGVSAYRGKNIQEGALGAFLEAVDRGHVRRGSYLLVESLDRLSRQTTHQAFKMFSDILSRGVNVVTLQDGRVYHAGGEGLDFQDMIISLVTMQRAHEESLTKSRRLAEVWEQKRVAAAQGTRKLTSVCPYWLRLNRDTQEFEVIEERAEIVRRIFSNTVDGIGKRTIAKSLNEEGVAPFGRSKGWQSSYVTKILDNPAVIGTYQPHKMREVQGKRRRTPEGEPIEGYFPAVVDKQTYFKAREIRQAQRIPTGRVAASYSNLFTGLGVCGVCGSPMHYENKGKPPKGGCYLVCSGARNKSTDCKRHSWRYLDAQAHILLNLSSLDYRELFPSIFEKVNSQRTELENKATVIAGELEDVASRIDSVLSALEKRPDSEAVFARLDALENQKKELEGKAAEVRNQLDSVVVQSHTFKDGYGELQEAMERFYGVVGTEEEYPTRQRLHQLLKRLLDSIVFTPGENEYHGLIGIRFKDADSHARMIDVRKGQKDSEGRRAGALDADCWVVDAQWPPRDRIVGGEFLRETLGVSRVQSPTTPQAKYGKG